MKSAEFSRKSRRVSQWLSHVTVVAAMVGATAGRASAQTIVLPPSYSLTDLGGAPQSLGFAIDGSGRSVVQALNGGFRTAPNQSVNAATDTVCPGFSAGTVSNPYAINGAGAVVGDAVVQSNGVLARHAFWWDGSTCHDLQNLTGAVTSLGRGMSDYGRVVGSFRRSISGLDQAYLAFFFGAGAITMTSLEGALGNPYSSNALDVNNLDQIVGYRQMTSTSYARGYVLQMAGAGWIFTDVGVLPGGVYSSANAINDNGVVVGQGSTTVNGTFATHAFSFRDANGNGVSDPGELVDLDTSGGTNSNALGVNSVGIVVGNIGVPGFYYTSSARAVVFVNGTVVDLNNMIPAGSGLFLEVANGINDGGQIVGYARDGAGNRHAFRLDPVYPILQLLPPPKYYAWPRGR